jgi:predicted DCC family thiol-disulfide oxidoreductase YuxK
LNFAEHPALFFDGVCNLCNNSVDWVIKHDKKRLFRFGSLQGVTAHRVIPQYAEEAGLSTVVLVAGNRTYIRSSAIGHVLKGIGGIFKLWGTLLLLLPPPLRDWGYKKVANSRYSRWGKRDSCRLPTPEERDLFLP